MAADEDPPDLTQAQREEGARLFSVLVKARDQLKSVKGVAKKQTAVNIRARRFSVEITRDDDELREVIRTTLAALADLPIDFVVKPKK